jgi:hypothetical protein
MVVWGVTDVCNAIFFFLICLLSTVRVHLGLLIDAHGFPDVQKVGFRAPKLLQGGDRCSQYRVFG